MRSIIINTFTVIGLIYKFIIYFQIMNRQRNGEIYVNAVFLFEFSKKQDNSTNFEHLESIALSFGGVNRMVSRFTLTSD